jgi:outer membrane protein, multidrug efflux system
VKRAGLLFSISLGVLALLALAGCAVGPRYSRPAAPAPAPDAWKTQPPWQQAAPKDAIPKGAWWQVYNDATLNDYEQQLLKANQSLQAAAGRLSQARSLARVATADFFPQLSADPSAVRERGSGNRPLNGAAPVVNGVTQTVSPYTQSVYTVPFSLSWEADVFGRVRRNVEAANATLQSTAADLQNVQLVLTAELAADYFSLRELDAEYQVVKESVGYQQRGLDLVNQRHAGGIASGLEVAQQATVLDSTVSQLSLVQQSRDQYEHAIAVLLGQPASTFSIPTLPLDVTPPPVPLGIPSDVLERRPDIATAERQMAYQNAEVGLARAAFYPHIEISNTGGGWQSTSITSLLNAPSLFWSIGADALQPIFQGGRNRANLAAARAAYDQSVANYRQTVLTAFQQVEDGISNLSTLSQALVTQGAAVEDARRALVIANNRYVGGVTNYLDVITAQTTLLSNQRLETQLLGQQMVNSVYLVKALGGSWNANELNNEIVHPKADQVLQQ